jgi:hypothetical protein
LRILVTFTSSAIIGWALGSLLFDRADAWPYVAALIAAGLAIPFCSGGESRPRQRRNPAGRWKASR